MKRLTSLLTLALSTSALFSQSLSDDTLAGQYLSPSELSFYEEYLSFFNSQIDCEDFATAEACWIDFLDGIQSGSVNNAGVTYDDLKEFMASHDTSGFSVWSKSPYVRFGQSDTSFAYSVDQNGSFFNLLLRASEENQFWQKVMDSYEQAGSFEVGIRNCLQKPDCNERLADPKMQVLLALYYGGFCMKLAERADY